MTRLQKLSASLLAGSCVFASTIAFAQDVGGNLSAQSAATQTAEPTLDIGTIDVQGAGVALGSGNIIQEDGPKDRSTVTAQGIQNLLPTVNPFQMISILPGINEVSEDSLGLAGGTIRVRGLVAAQMGFTINGAPFNDSGNFNVYPSEIIDSENVQQIWVTHGSTDIDAPHVGASGGNIGVVTRAPYDAFNLRLSQGAGELSQSRSYIGVDTGAFDLGALGSIKALASYSYTHADKWRGDGTYNRRHTDGNVVWQISPDSSVGLTWLYNDSVNPYYRDYSSSGIYNVFVNGLTGYQTFKEVGPKVDYDTFWGQPGYAINLIGPYSTKSCATNPNPACTVTDPNYPQLGNGSLNTNASNYYALNVNPYRNGVITVPVNWQVTDNLRWETNGYLWFGQGGAVFGSTALDDNETISCTASQTAVSASCPNSYTAAGYTIGKVYGDTGTKAQALLLAQGTINKTLRPGVTTKLIYDMDNYTFMVGAWMEHSRMDYATPYSLVNANGTPCDVWMTDFNNNPCLLQGTSVNGAGPVFNYHYIANSIGESAFFEVQGRYLNDTLKFNAGLAYREVVRDVRNLNPYCADMPSLVTNPGTTGTCAATATSPLFTTSAAYQYFNGPTVGAAAAYAAMRQFGANPHIHWMAALPEFTASYDIDENQQIYASLSTGLRTPNVANLTTFYDGLVMNVSSFKPEYSTSYETGYRWHDGFLQASATGYLQDIKNYLATVYVDQIDKLSTNIGGVKIYGLDFEAGTRPWHNFTFYGSAEIQNSVVDKNVGSGFSGTVLYVNSHGKQLVDTPNWIMAADIGYAQDGFFGDLRPQCRGQRATALLNDEFVPAYCTVNASLGYRFKGGDVFKSATLQLYGSNITGTKYFGEIYSTGTANAKAAPAYNAAGNPIAGTTAFAGGYTGEPGAPFFFGARLSVDIN